MRTGSGNNVPVRLVMRNRTVWAMGNRAHHATPTASIFCWLGCPCSWSRCVGYRSLEMTWMIPPLAYCRSGLRRAVLGLAVRPSRQKRVGRRPAAQGPADQRLSADRCGDQFSGSDFRLSAPANSGRGSCLARYSARIGGANPYAIAQIYAGPRGGGHLGRGP